MLRIPPQRSDGELSKSDAEMQQASVELASIQVEKEKHQAELSGIIENKNNLVTKFSTEADKLNNDFLNRKKELEIKIRSIQDKLDHISAELDVSEKNKKTLIESIFILSKQKKSLDDEVFGLRSVKENLDRDIKEGEQKIKDQDISLKSFNSSVAIIEAKKNLLEKEVLSFELKISDKRLEHDRIASMNTNNQSLSDIAIENKKKIESEIESLREVVRSKCEELAKTTIELNDVQSILSDHKISMKKKEGEIATRLENAGKVEKRVNEKIEQLKFLKSEFTVEHLARIGFKD
jgi:hypothetical protein